jgi:hypothetical protein
MNRAAKGRRLEHKMRDILRAACAAHPGRLLMVRTVGSRGSVDLVTLCFACGPVQLVQVKANRWLSVDERDRLGELDASGRPSRPAPKCGSSSATPASPSGGCSAAPHARPPAADCTHEACARS